MAIASTRFHPRVITAAAMNAPARKNPLAAAPITSQPSSTPNSTMPSEMNHVMAPPAHAQTSAATACLTTLRRLPAAICAAASTTSPTPSIAHTA